MAQDDTARDDTTGQEYNEDDRVDETLHNQGVDPADVRDSDKQDMQQDMEDMDDSM